VVASSRARRLIPVVPPQIGEGKMRTVAMIALVLPLVQNGAAAQIVAGESGLELRYELIDLEDPRLGQPKEEFQVHVEIVNRGTKDVVIPTKGVGPITSWLGQAAYISFQPLVIKTRDGLPIAKSMADLAPVELRSGEVAVLHCDIRIPKNTIMASLKYELSRAFADRYGFWSGKLAAQIRRTPEAEQTDERAPD
jgi:hypothetical protein